MKTSCSNNPQSQFDDYSDDSDSDSNLPPLIPDLPDDIAARCIAFLPLSSHPSLSVVSRSFRYLLRSHSHLLFNLRSHLRALEPQLLISLRTPTNPSLWFLLPGPCPIRPIPLPSPPIPAPGSAACPAGPYLYLLGGSHHGLSTHAVQILDPRRRRWSPGPYMRASREFPAAAALAGRIYIIGGCLPSNSNWAESMEVDPAPNTNQWTPVPSPFHLRDKWMHGHAVLDGKLLAVADRGGVLFDPAMAEWAPVSSVLDLGWKGRAVVVGGILYSYDYLGKIKGYDPARDAWIQVEGLERVLPRFLCGATLADFGGFLCLVWERKKAKKMMMEISSAGIEISRTEDGGLRGEVAWLEESVLTVPRGSTIAHCVAMEM